MIFVSLLSLRKHHDIKGPCDWALKSKNYNIPRSKGLLQPWLASLGSTWFSHGAPLLRDGSTGPDGTYSGAHATKPQPLPQLLYIKASALAMKFMHIASASYLLTVPHLPTRVVLESSEYTTLAAWDSI